jgi:hypothetical protein
MNTSIHNTALSEPWLSPVSPCLEKSKRWCSAFPFWEHRVREHGLREHGRREHGAREPREAGARGNGRERRVSTAQAIREQNASGLVRSVAPTGG